MANIIADPSETMTSNSVQVMRRQEETNYIKYNVLQELSMRKSSVEIDEECRYKMVEWCFEVVDFCEMSRETVEIAMSYFDRFLLTEQGSSATEDLATYQLACMTALYTAIKMHEHRVISPNFVSRLSQGIYHSSAIEAMETKMAMSLNWYLNPPTSFAFLRQYLTLIPNEIMDSNMKGVAYDLAKMQNEAAMKRYELSTIKASTIAYSSLMNALKSVVTDFKLLACVQVINHAIMDCSCENIVSKFMEESVCIRNLLYQSITMDGNHASTTQLPSSTNVVATTCDHQGCGNEADMEYSPRSCSTTAFVSTRVVS